MTMSRVGLNSRLDTLQAAILIEKLAILEDEMEARQEVARRYAMKVSAAW
jgi:dTDP-4-amino-4,6-dideoxygalactose transaminase